MRFLFSFLLIFIFISIPLFSETQTPVPTPLPTAAPYEEDEFPQWQKDIRRAEVILIGSFPFTMFLAVELFDIYRFVSYDFNSVFAPWPFKGQLEAGYNQEEKIGIIVAAVSVSVCIAIVDYIIVKIRREKKFVPDSKK